MKYYGLILMFIFCTNSFAQQLEMNFSRINYGYENQYMTARSLGLAGAGVAGDDASASIFLNPALAVYSKSWLNLNTGLSVYKLEEDRSFPYYDNFGGFVDYGSYVYNKYWYSQFYSVLTSRLPFDNLLGLSIATGFVPFQSFDYDYLEEVRSDYYGDALLAYNQISSDGVLNAIPFNIAFKPVDKLLSDSKISIAIGAGVKILTGSINQLKKVETKTASLSGLDYENKNKRDLDNLPVIPSAGIRIKIGDRFSFGSALRLPYDIKFINKIYETNALKDTAYTVDQKLSYPMKLSLGTEYRFQNILEARIFTDFIYTFWENFKDSETEDLNFDNTYDVRAGIEHIFFNKVPFRVGFDYGTLRESKNYSRAVLSAGTGIIMNNLQLDMAVGISSLVYRQADMFDNADYGMDSVTDADRVRWNQLYVRIDVNYVF